MTAPYDARMVGYLDNVGKIHTPGSGPPRAFTKLLWLQNDLIARHYCLRGPR